MAERVGIVSVAQTISGGYYPSLKVLFYLQANSVVDTAVWIGYAGSPNFCRTCKEAIWPRKNRYR